MKIIFISTDCYDASGAFLSMINLAIELKKMGISSFMIVPKGDEGGEALLKENEVPYKRYRMYHWTCVKGTKRGISFFIKKYIKICINHFQAIRISYLGKKLHGDIIHINTICSYIGYPIAKKMKVPLVWHIRELFEENGYQEFWSDKVTYKYLAKADKIIAISDIIGEKYKKLLPNNKISVIYNGIHKRFIVKDREILDKKKINIVCVGKIYHVKNQKIVIEAVNKCINGFGSHVYVNFVGDADLEYLSECMGLIEKYGLEAYVTFSGNQKDTLPYYKCADISLTCSSYEGFGRVTVEAMMAGCLVIGSCSGATKDILQHKVSGMLYKKEDAQALAESIQYVKQHVDECRLIAKEGQKIAIEKYTSVKNAEQIAKVYQDLHMSCSK